MGSLPACVKRTYVYALKRKHITNKVHLMRNRYNLCNDATVNRRNPIILYGWEMQSNNNTNNAAYSSCEFINLNE